MKISAFLRDQHGVASIEAAILLPALLTFLFGMMDASLYYWRSSALQQGVNEAARCSAIERSDCITETQVKQFASDRSYGLAPPTSVFTVSQAVCGTQISAATMNESAFGGFSPFHREINVSACY